MSFEAMAWAAKQSCKNSLTKLVLLMLANYSDENDSTYPSYKHLSVLCECNERSIMRAIKSLHEDSLISVEKRFTDTGKQTSNRFILNVFRGDRIDTQRVTNNTLNTIRVIQEDKTKRGDKYAPEFLEWWNAYPRNDGSKAKAYEIWKRVVDKDINARDLFLKTCKFKRTTIDKDKKFIPHATTWLNQRRWETVDEEQSINKNKNQLAG
jgi:hypothetical protein